METKPKVYPTIPTLFIKKAIQSIFSTNTETIEVELTNKIKEFAKFNKFNEEEVTYFFIKESIKHGFFFQIQEDARDIILYRAIKWASINETRNKTKPKTKDEIREDKRDAFFTQLQKELIVGLYKYEDTSSMKFEITLTKYICFFFDLSCIKRTKK